MDNRLRWKKKLNMLLTLPFACTCLENKQEQQQQKIKKQKKQ